MSDITLSDELVDKIAEKTAIILKNDKEFMPSFCASILENNNMPINNPSMNMLTTDDVIKQSGLGIQVIRRHIHKGLLIGTKIGKRYFFSQENINNYLNTNKKND